MKFKKKPFRLDEHFQTLVLDNTIKLPHQGQRNKRVKKDTLFKDREPQKPYPSPRHVPI